MKLLAIDTSTERAALAVVSDGPTVHVATPDPSRRHGRNLIPAIRDLLETAGLALTDLDGFAVGLGPGSYTGLRIGLTAIKTLAYAAGKPLVGLDSLEVVARNAPEDAARVSVVADAQRGDLYVADFHRAQPSGPLRPAAPIRIETQKDWLARLVEPTCVLGPGLERFSAPLPQAARMCEPRANWPDGHRLIAVACDAWNSGRRDDPWFLEPLYLRRSAAEEQWDRRYGPTEPATRSP